MADFMSKVQRSRAMSAVRGSETEIERRVRSELHKRGFRFRKNVSRLPGRPDIVLPKYRTVVFVHGCFWHRHDGCSRSKLPASNRRFWSKKIGDNVKRDQRQVRALISSGWRVLIVWECELRTLQDVVERLMSALNSRFHPSH